MGTRPSLASGTSAKGGYAVALFVVTKSKQVQEPHTGPHTVQLLRDPRAKLNVNPDRLCTPIVTKREIRKDV